MYIPGFRLMIFPLERVSLHKYRLSGTRIRGIRTQQPTTTSIQMTIYGYGFNPKQTITLGSASERNNKTSFRASLNIRFTHKD